MILLSITGLVRTILIIIGVVVIARFIGQVMVAKRRQAEERDMERERRAARAEREKVMSNQGRMSISRKPKGDSGIEYTDYEEVE